MAGRQSDPAGVYPLTAWVRRCAVNVRVHMSVVEPACQDRHRGRAEAAAINGAFVIATLPSRDTADDRPARSASSTGPMRTRISVSIVVTKRGYRQATAWRLPWSSSAKKPTYTCRQCPFQKSGSQAPRKPFAGRAADAERFGVFRFAVFVARAAMTAAPRCCRRRPAGPGGAAMTRPSRATSCPTRIQKHARADRRPVDEYLQFTWPEAARLLQRRPGTCARPQA